MSKVAVVYWSGTGNTEKMAEIVVSAAQAAGADVTVYQASDFSGDAAADYAAIAFGCPAMGAEELEETEFEPMFSSVKPALNGKKIALFGSYDWGDGEWMRTWEEDVKENGVTLVCGSIIANNEPDDEAAAALEAMGTALAGA